MIKLAPNKPLSDKARAVNAKQTLSTPYITDPTESAQAPGIIRGQTIRINRATRQTHCDYRQNSREQQNNSDCPVLPPE